MKLLISALLLLFSLSSHRAFAVEYGYMSYLTDNIGDDIQSIAARRFLPTKGIPIERDALAKFKHDGPVKTVVNGWFMNRKEGIYSWPPSKDIDPFFISIHLNRGFFPSVFSKESIDYLKKHAPVGARDFLTLVELQKRGIPSYYSGCLTLTLRSHVQHREDVIYVVDLDSEIIDYIRSKTKSQVVKLTHYVDLNESQNRDHEERTKLAESLLYKYRRAKCVVTRRLHATLPCLAFETPVLLVGAQSYRFDGFRKLVRHCSKRDLLDGKVDFDFDNPTPNSKDYLPIRENMIKLMVAWTEKSEASI